MRPKVLFGRDGKPRAGLHGGVVGHHHALAPAHRPQSHHRAARRAAALLLVHLVPGEEAQLPRLLRVVDQILDALPRRELAPIVLLLNLLGPAPLPHLVGTLPHGFDEGFVVGGLFLKRSAVSGGVGAKGVGLGHLSCDVGRGM